MVVAAACGAPSDRPVPPEPAQAAPAPVVTIGPGEIAAAIARLAEADPPAGEGATGPQEHAEVEALYSAGGTLWLDPQGQPNMEARAALALLAASADEGLDPADYQTATLERLAASAADPGAQAGVRAAFDVALSRQVLRFWRHVHLGRVDPRAIGHRIPGPAHTHDFPSMLRTAVAGRRLGAATNDLLPPLALYHAVVRELARYRQLAAGATRFEMTEPDVSIKPGASFPHAPALRAWLVALGDLPPDTPALESDVYDDALVGGVERFQRRHGLEADGVIGRRTAAALGVPLARRVHQLALALERLRWLPHLTGESFIAVNIPMFRLWGWDEVRPGGSPAFSMNVIVGRALDTETPLLVEHMRYVTFRPYWNVPPSITRGEILPQLERDAGYLDRQNMEIVSGWTDEATRVEPTPENLARLREGRLRVRQRPGPGNSLGLVKFSFPNDDNIFIHGTPAPHLFGRARRDFSHGCVRAEDPLTLARWVLRDQPEWTRERMLAAMNGDRPLRVNLTRPLPVILFYLTAVVMPEDGSVHFAEDIYGHDERLTRALGRP